ncbi:uncharacterized protein L3040_005563 [Drepanopeziza brunnea f. sp. 'multigermtubi']|uniref:Pentatricopeptide repeat protein n=1 Tax=Marssonina brunnea f. sp. multigermtubi (strain MB_m1) TaxID=1072389 RepID=K1WYV6_MARBU|nr:pentatricopeptide repeat protein [Drepanopeziza brunnea f. sp. 'multigermtubi' MB_m1]EKD13818.1 pentatricopeptide repeat protein [Drepanopeziza brunnea f. sp. 'multigermtubi' MB_m1]KAJ5041005.1 hypothetical protein L3040_005563 [Drepanopeziza brunnea f. sp. 'multigermtubi']
MVSNSLGFEAWFIKSLADAGNCHKPTKRSQPSSFFTARRPNVPLRRRQSQRFTFQRHNHTQDFEAEYDYESAETDELQRAEEEKPFEPNRTKEELLELVDQSTGRSYTDQLPLLDMPQLYQPSDGPHLTVSDKPEDEWPPPDYTWPSDPETKIKLEEIRIYMRDCWQAKKPVNQEELYRLYRALPAPRAPYLPSKLRHSMMHHLSIVEKKDENSMLRYMSVVDDMKVSGIPLNTYEWTSAISFAARYVKRSTEVEVEAALHLWREMEHVANVKATAATFNVLFDVACKAGKLVLAEMIYKEMETRGLEYDRFHHVSLIFYYGLRKSGDGVRHSYKALVEGGEIVDTVVLNAMISALIRSCEASSAEKVYERMKAWHFEREHPQLPPRDYHRRRVVNLALTHMGKISKTNLELREKFQSKSIVAPDLHTFEILITHYANTSGELEKISKLLDDMKVFGLGVHKTIFLRLLQGFATHGGIRYTKWTEARLESVWKSFLQALDDGNEDVEISQWIIAWAFQAFSNCSGRERTMQAWEEIRSRWKDPDDAELDFAMGKLRQVMEKPGRARMKEDFFLGM